MQTAKNRQIDLARRAAVFKVKREEIGREAVIRDELTEPAPTGSPKIDDDVLRLIFTTCHPTLTRDSQVALTLRLVGGLSTEEIARALLTSEATVGQRISRAKRTLADEGSPFEVPEGDELAPRLAAVLGVVYLIFNEGYTATKGDDWMRIELCEDALRFGRQLQALIPGEPEVHGLAALMEIQASRVRARTDAGGNPIPLLEQNRAQWDQTLIRRGLAAIDRALVTPGAKGVYTLQAQIASCHVRARKAEDTDWAEISRLYGHLHELTGSPIVVVNRAVAVGFAESPEAGLDMLAEVEAATQIDGYHLFFSVRGDLMEKAGRRAEAADDFARAARMTRNEREREVLERRVSELRLRTDP